PRPNAPPPPNGCTAPPASTPKTRAARIRTAAASWSTSTSPSTSPPPRLRARGRADDRTCPPRPHPPLPPHRPLRGLRHHPPAGGGHLPDPGRGVLRHRLRLVRGGQEHAAGVLLARSVRAGRRPL